MNAFKSWGSFDQLHRSLSKLISETIRENSGIRLDTIEWMIMNSLFAEDGQHASVLANSVGRAATSFTPILDRLQKKGYIERRSDTADRRAVKIFITKKGHANKDRIDILNPVIQKALAKYCEDNNLGAVWALFVKVVAG